VILKEGSYSRKKTCTTAKPVRNQARKKSGIHKYSLLRVGRKSKREGAACGEGEGIVKKISGNHKLGNNCLQERSRGE